MRHLRKFNESSDDSITEKDIEDLFIGSTKISIPLKEIIKGNSFFIRLNNGKIFEYFDGKLDQVWENDDELKDHTGVSLSNEYKGNRSDEFLDFLNPKKLYPLEIIDSAYDEIEGVYFEGEPVGILKYILGSGGEWKLGIM